MNNGEPNPADYHHCENDVAYHEDLYNWNKNKAMNNDQQPSPVEKEKLYRPIKSSDRLPRVNDLYHTMIQWKDADETRFPSTTNFFTEDQKWELSEDYEVVEWLEEYTPEGSYQDRVNDWMIACFGEEISKDIIERNHRFFEEATELAQSTGMTKSECLQLVDYVFNRAKGETIQEIGGVMVTLAALCNAVKLSMVEGGEKELARIWTKVEKIREKQANKPKHSRLPQSAPPADLQGAASEGKDAFTEWEQYSEKVQKLKESVLDMNYNSFIGTRSSCKDWIPYGELTDDEKECVFSCMSDFADQLRLLPVPTPTGLQEATKKELMKEYDRWYFGDGKSFWPTPDQQFEWLYKRLAGANWQAQQTKQTD